MNETNTNAAENTAQQETEQPEQKAPAENTFTQKELDDIVKQLRDVCKRLSAQPQGCLRLFR